MGHKEVSTTKKQLPPIDGLGIALKLYAAGGGSVASLTEDWKLSDVDAAAFLVAVRGDWRNGLHKDRRVNPERRGAVLTHLCHAVIHHGPGHQSHTHCQVFGVHEIHSARYGHDRDLAEWRSDEVFSGAGDEPPSVDE